MRVLADEFGSLAYRRAFAIRESLFVRLFILFWRLRLVLVCQFADFPELPESEAENDAVEGKHFYAEEHVFHGVLAPGAGLTP